MKLVSRLTHFIKYQQQPLFRRPHKQQANDLPSILDLNPDPKPAKINVPLQTDNTQMRSEEANNKHNGKIPRKQDGTEQKKAMFHRRAELQRQVPPANDLAIIKQKHQKIVQSNHLSKIIRKTQLPIDLFSIHSKYCKQFTHYNYEHLFIKLSFTFHHREVILKNLRRTINNFNLPTIDEDYRGIVGDKQYLFLTKDQMINHQQWKKLVQQILSKLRQIQDISAFNLYLPTILAIQQNFNFIPAQIFQYVLARNVKANFDDLSTAHISNLISLLKYINRIKQTTQEDSSDELSVETQNLVQKLAAEIINHAQRYTKQDFLNVFIVANRRKKRINIFSEELLDKSEILMREYMVDFNFQSILTFTKMYTFFHSSPSRNFLEALKEGLQEKCSSETNQYSLLMLLQSIKQRRLLLKNLQGSKTVEQTISLNGDALSLKVAQALSKDKKMLNPIQIYQFLQCCFDNDIKDSSVLAEISKKFSRSPTEYSLQALAKGLFKLSLLGYRSSNLLTQVIRQFAQRYENQMQLLQKEDCFSPPNAKEGDCDSSLNFKQIHLQQCLIILIWTAIQAQGVSSALKLKQISKIYPSKIKSTDPLIIELVANINHRTKDLSGFSQMKCEFDGSTLPIGKLSQLYRHEFSKNEAQLLMWEQAEYTNSFVANYNFKTKQFLPERWSSVATYKLEDYIRFCLMEKPESSNKSCYFDESVMLPSQFLQRRHRIIKKFAKENKICIVL